jgi:transposase
VAARGKKKAKRERPDINLEELDSLVDAARSAPLSPEEANKLKSALHLMADHLADFYRTSEKLNKIIDEVAEQDDTGKTKEADLPKKPAPGHGRNKADDYVAAEVVKVSHPDLQRGCRCPGCEKGKLGKHKPGQQVKIEAMPPITARRYEREKLRCNLCGEIYTAPLPDGVSKKKYDDSVAAMLAILKYGHGFPHKRIETMQKNLGVPLSDSVQSELLKAGAELLKPIHQHLINEAAQSSLLHTDDTRMKIIKFRRDPEDSRTGLFTSGILGVTDEFKVSLFFTGAEHAGENLAYLLEHRAKDLESPVLMCDALSWNTSKLKAPDAVVLANCLAHGRRKFVDIVDSFPSQCLHVLTELGKVYVTEQVIREEKLSAKDRLARHRKYSKPVMEALEKWMEAQLESEVEPNSRLGKAFRYLQKNWKALTRFLKDGKAPLDNNICERAIKKAVLNRKNAFFYRTLNGAQVGDLWMSLIHTCELNGVNPFDYLCEVLRNPIQVAEAPEDWLPWHFQAGSRGSPA